MSEVRIRMAGIGDQMIMAAQSGDVDKLRTLIMDGGDVNYADIIVSTLSYDVIYHN